MTIVESRKIGNLGFKPSEVREKIPMNFEITFLIPQASPIKTGAG